MCGIVGVIGARPAAPLLVEGLQRLEYRGYDSAGIATLVADGIERRRAEGKLAQLVAVLQTQKLDGTTGIGHTRWATHGAPTEQNAHPHGTARVAVVHNGIIENHAELRAELESLGQVFETETDTETVAQLLDLYLKRGMVPADAAALAFRRLEGAFALAIIFAGHPDLIICTQQGAPLAIGYGEDEMFLGSDALALQPMTPRVAYLQTGDWAIIARNGARFFNSKGTEVTREIKLVRGTGAAIGKGQYRHFMEKELHEHPAVIGDTLRQMIDPGTRQVALPPDTPDFSAISRITLTACGSAYYAGLVGRYWFESLSRIPVDADIASELRYREPPLPENGLALLISQSGETADTLAAMRMLRANGQKLLSILNVAESTMARESDVVLETIAGPEISVASTKAFTAQLAVMACLAIAAARVRGIIDVEAERRLTATLLEVPSRVGEVLAERDADVQRIAARIAESRDVIYLGRGTAYPVALEGALKLKETSYIHAEAYAAGELKHGPIALIDKAMPVVAIAPSGPSFEKTASNLQEVQARGGKLMIITDQAGAERLRGIATELLVLPDIDPFAAPILYTVPVQLLAYHVAVLKGTDMDQPRNLAKSVTVE